MKRLLRSVLCRFIGHDDRRQTPLGISAAPCVECHRCGRVGWVIPC